MSIITTVCLISTILTSLSIHSSVRASHLDRIGLDTSSYLLSMADKISPTEDLPDGKEKVCLTKECRKIGKLYDMAMDKTVHPCDNFYQYSCGNWEGSSQDLGYEGTVRQLDILSEITEDRRQAMLWHPPYDTDIQPVQQAKIFFQSCMDYTAREVRGIRTIAAVIGSAGGWPMAMTTEYWSNTSRTWQAVDESHVRLGMNNAFFSINPGIDQGKDGKPVIVVNAPDPGDLPVIRNNYDDYREFVQDVLEEFIRYDKATISPEQLEKDIYDLYIFEHKLNKIREISGVNIISFNPQRKYSEQEIYWQKIIRHHFALNILEINETYQASLVDPYYNLLPKLLDSTETRTIVNYIHWKFVSRTMRYTNTKMRNIYYRFKRSPDRLQECLKDTKLIYAEVNWFLQNYFSDDYQKAVEIIAENVRNELNYQIDNSNWLQDSTKAALLDQISNITLFIGGPKWCTNQTAIEYHYETFITSPDYVSNMLSFWNYQNKYRFNLFSGSEKPPSWDTFPLTVSAHYRLASNVITITAGQLQTPFFGSTLPDYLNYGAIGSIIGHEFAHAADAAIISQGSQPTYLFPERNVMDLYTEQILCIVEYFNDHSNNTKLVAQTSDEDLSDVIGIQASFAAYRRLGYGFRPTGQIKLPGFESFSATQMFFIAYSQNLCETKVTGSGDPWAYQHSPSENRVNGAVRNMPQFARAFNCPVGSPMNPLHKCNIWKTRL